jgi:tetratricopeptide (TPR) repeat protein
MRKSAEPAAEGAWRNLYSLYLEKREFAKADKLVEDALRSSPRNRWAIQAQGFLLRMLRPEAEWETFLRERSSWQDSLFEIQVAYGKFLKDRSRWQEAVKYYNRGLEGAPQNGPAWLELADVYYQLGDLAAAEQCIFNSFRYGIRDPYVYELYGLVLQDLAVVYKEMEAVYRGFRDEIREFHEGLDARKIKHIMQRAEKILEEGFNHDLQSRSMAQLLYHLYCGNGRVEAARNLRQGFWFHFSGPPRPQPPPRLFSGYGYREPHLHVRFSEVSFPLVRALEKTDFFEPF